MKGVTLPLKVKKNIKIVQYLYTISRNWAILIQIVYINPLRDVKLRLCTQTTLAENISLSMAMNHCNHGHIFAKVFVRGGDFMKS
jgi:hypothetical protein